MRGTQFMPIEKFYPLKSVFESVWGKGTYLELKHCSDLKVWKKYAERTLKASKLAIQETIEVTDDYWQETTNEIISHGIESIKISKDFDDLFQSLSATYIELSFHQIGLMPAKSYNSRAQLRKQYWKLDCYRSVQYVQNSEQKRAVQNKMEKHRKQAQNS